MPKATFHDGSIIEIEVDGEGPTLLLPVNPQLVTGSQAEAMRQWGANPALGHSLIAGLRDAFRIVAFDYEGHLLRMPRPDSLTPANAVSDLLAIADAAGADRFAYYGYSWLALIGLQLAIRTDRLTALVMGDWPPLNGPYAQMLRVTTAAHEMAVEVAAKRDEGAADQQPAIEAGDWSKVGRRGGQHCGTHHSRARRTGKPGLGGASARWARSPAGKAGGADLAFVAGV